MLSLYNGKIRSGGDFYEAIAIEDGSIAALGSNEEIRSFAANAGCSAAGGECGGAEPGQPDNREIDLKGNLVLPGFIDSHAHGALSMALLIDRIDLRPCKSVDEYAAAIKAFIAENPEKDIYYGCGWSSALFPEKGPEKEMLDALCPDKPMILKAIEGHAIWVNSKAIEDAGVTPESKVPTGGTMEKNDDSSVRGCFKDEAQKLIEDRLPDMPVELYKEAIRQYQQLMVPYGYTGACEMQMYRNNNMHKAYKEMAEAGELIMKAGMHYVISPNDDMKFVKESLANPVRTFENKLADGFYIKIFIDGVIENATGWLKEPYANNPENIGVQLWEDGHLFEVCAYVDSLGYDIHFHVIGDAAVNQMVRAMEYVKQANGDRPDRRPVAAHVQLADKEDIKRMAELGFCVSANPYWFGIEQNYYYGVEVPLLGKERAERQYPMKSLMDAGMVVSAGSDFSVTAEPYPVGAVKLGMERCLRDIIEGADEVLWEEECAGLEEMVDAVTKNAAYTSRMDEKTGTIEVGKLADLVVLSRNIFEIPSKEFMSVQALMTISEGEIVFSQEF